MPILPEFKLLKSDVYPQHRHRGMTKLPTSRDLQPFSFGVAGIRFGLVRDCFQGEWRKEWRTARRCARMRQRADPHQGIVLTLIQSRARGLGMGSRPLVTPLFKSRALRKRSAKLMGNAGPGGGESCRMMHPARNFIACRPEAASSPFERIKKSRVGLARRRRHD